MSYGQAFRRERSNGKRADTDDEYDSDDGYNTRRNDGPRRNSSGNQDHRNDDYNKNNNNNNNDYQRRDQDRHRESFPRDSPYDARNNTIPRLNLPRQDSRNRNERDRRDDSYGDNDYYDDDDNTHNIVRDVRNRFRKLIQDSNVVTSATSFWPSGKKKAAMQQIGLRFRSQSNRKVVTVHEFQNALISLYQQTGGARRSLTTSDLKQVVDAIDTDQDGKISFSELISFVTFESRELRAVARDFARGLRARGESARSIFEQVSSGRYVDIKKFTTFLRLKQMTDLSVDETATLLQWFDTNGDGKVDVAEFASFLEDYTTSLMLTMKNEVAGFVTDLCLSANATEEATLRHLQYAQVPGGSLNQGSLGKRLFLWKKEAKHDTRTHFSPRSAVTDVLVHQERRSTHLYANGYDVLRTSANAGLLHVGAKHQYIWFKRRSMLIVEKDAPPILDVVVTAGKARNLDSKLYSVPSAGYVRVNANLNEGALFGKDIFVWVKKGNEVNTKRLQPAPNTVRAVSVNFKVMKDPPILPEKELFLLSDRARLAMRVHGQGTGNPIQLFVNESKQKWSYRQFKSIARWKCNIAINNKGMESLFHCVDHDNDGYITVQDFTLFVQLSGAHLDCLAAQLRVAVLGEKKTASNTSRSGSRREKGNGNGEYGDISRLRGALDQIYDDCAGKSEMNCSSLSQLLLKATGILLTEAEAGRLMNVMTEGIMNHGIQGNSSTATARGQSSSLVRTSNNSTTSTANNQVGINEFSSRRLSREQFHNFFEHGVQAGKSSQRRIARAVVLLQDYMRHVAIAKMSVVRKALKKRTIQAAATVQSGGASSTTTAPTTSATPATLTSSGGSSSSSSTSNSSLANVSAGATSAATLEAIHKNDEMILMEGAKAAWRSMDPAGTQAVPIDQQRHTVHLQNCLQAAASWKGKDTLHALSHAEFVGLTEIMHPGSLEDSFSFEALCHFAGIGPGSARPITSVCVARTAKDATDALELGYWRGNYLTSELDNTCNVQFWYERNETNWKDVESASVSDVMIRSRTSRGTRSWKMAEQPINDRAELYLFYKTGTTARNDGRRRSRNRNQRRYDDEEDGQHEGHTVVSIAIGNKRPGRVAGHAVFSDNHRNVCTYQSIEGSELLRGQMECWVARSDQPSCIFSKHERIADGFKVGDHVRVKRTGFLQTGDGTLRSNKHKGETSGVVVAMVLNGNAGGNVKWSSRRPVYDVRDTLNGKKRLFGAFWRSKKIDPWCCVVFIFVC